MTDLAEQRRSIVKVFLKGDVLPEGGVGPFDWKFVPRQGEVVRLPPPAGKDAWPSFTVERVEWWHTHAVGCESYLNADIWLKREK